LIAQQDLEFGVNTAETQSSRVIGVGSKSLGDIAGTLQKKTIEKERQ